MLSIILDISVTGGQKNLITPYNDYCDKRILLKNIDAHAIMPKGNFDRYVFCFTPYLHIFNKFLNIIIWITLKNKGTK